MTAESLPIARIRRDGGTQTRAEISADKVAEYSEDMRAGAEFPAVVVFHDGSTYWLADGFHRVAAAEAAGLAEVACEVKQGDRRAAILYSVGANHDHGLPRSPADKRRAVETTLRLFADEGTRKSDGDIAEICRVSKRLVFDVRTQLVQMHKLTLPTSVAASDGKTYETKNIGKARAAATPPPPPSDAPNPFVAVRSAIVFARTSADLATAADELARYEERGSLSPKEAAELRAAYTVASTRVLLDDKPTPPGGRARKVVLDDEEGAAARVRATPVDPPEGANDDDEDDESAPGQVFEAADEPEVRREPEHDRWGSFDVSSHVLKVIGACKSAEASIGALFAAVDPRFSGEVRQRCQDSVLRLMRSLDALLPPDGRMAESNRKTFEVIKGGV